MSKIPEKIKPGWAIPVDIKESFVEFCSHIGTVAQEDCAGALFLWQYMPAQPTDATEDVRWTKGGYRLDHTGAWIELSP